MSTIKSDGKNGNHLGQHYAFTHNQIRMGIKVIQHTEA